MLWYKSVQKYTMKGINDVEQLSKNVDLELIPKIVEKVVLNKIDRKYLCRKKKLVLDISNTYLSTHLFLL